jgi:hypothetical protein
MVSRLPWKQELCGFDSRSPDRVYSRMVKWHHDWLLTSFSRFESGSWSSVSSHSGQCTRLITER